jgi:hypothetical protein
MGRFAKSVKAGKIGDAMEKINIYEQEPDFIERPLRDIESGSNSRLQSRPAGKVTEPATKGQLMLLNRLGIYPKWQATRYEAQEMIDYHQLILNSVDRRRW